MFEGIDSATLKVFYTIDSEVTFKNSGASLETLVDCLQAMSDECRPTSSTENFSASELGEIQRGLISAQRIVVATFGKKLQ